MTKHLPGVAALFLAAGALAPAGPADEHAAIETRAARLRPSADMLRWYAVPWLHDLRNEAVRQAKAEKLPLFVWVADGEPLDRC
jgi:hypothetical protein